MVFSNEEMEEFKAEALDLLDVAEKSLLALDSGADFRPAFDAIFRGFHNLKGAAGMMELLKLQAHTHELENILMQFKEDTTIPKAHVNLFLRGIDAARALLDNQDVSFDFSVTEEAPLEKPLNNSVLLDIPQSAVDEFIAESEEIIDRVSDVLALLESRTHKKENIESLYRDVHSLKGSSYLFSFNTLGDIAHAMESSLDGIRNETHEPTPALIDTLFKSIKTSESELKNIKTKNPSTNSSATAALIDELNAIAGQLPIACEKSTLPQQTTAPEATTALPPSSNETPVSAPSSQKDRDAEGNGSIRVPVALLDNLMTLMGEMVLVRNQVLQFSSQSEDLEFLNLSKRLNAVTSEIQGEMMKTRMQPIGNILSKFNRVVRDLSHELGKDISLSLHGSETELDKSLLEAIKDPLTHIVRNSCDHGIETPDVRLKNGKPKNGSIVIRSYHEGGQMVIEVNDDGKGLNKDMLIKKALEKGLISPSKVSELSEKEIFNLIFLPGFSTAANVTNISGRGVGMDVVRTNVERIGGSVELTSIAGFSTTTKLKIPLTLAIVPALLIRCGKGTFAIPQMKLEELVRVDQSSPENRIEYVHGTPVYRLRGNILPIISLNKILGLPDDQLESSRTHNIAVVSADQCVFGLIIDEVYDTADIVVKPINRLLKSLQAYSGATILGDGSVALILDVHGLAKMAQIGSENLGVEDSSRRNEDKKVTETQDFLLVQLNSPTKHAIVLNYVFRLEEFKASEVEYSANQRLIRYGSSILPIISVSEQLGYGARKKESSEKLSIVVIEKAGVLYGLEVESTIDTFSTTVEMSQSLIPQVGIFGHINTPDELIVAIDPFDLINKAYPESALTPKTPVSIDGKNQAPASNAAVAGPLKILVVEDTPFFRKALSYALTQGGHDVTTAIDGLDAMEILEKNPEKFDLLVSDIEMPRMNGFALAKWVRSHKLLSHLPALAISSRADKRYISQGIEAGFNIYLEKLKPEILLNAVDKLITSKRNAA